MTGILDAKYALIIGVIVTFAGGYFYGHRDGYNAAGIAICADKKEAWVRSLGRCLSNEQLRELMKHVELKPSAEDN